MSRKDAGCNEDPCSPHLHNCFQVTDSESRCWSQSADIFQKPAFFDGILCDSCKGLVKVRSSLRRLLVTIKEAEEKDAEFTEHWLMKEIEKLCKDIDFLESTCAEHHQTHPAT